eukprot:365558-Chlamydomonas_euryale.AAC.26
MRTVGKCAKLVNAHGGEMRTAGKCARLGDAHSWEMHTAGECTHLARFPDALQNAHAAQINQDPTVGSRCGPQNPHQFHARFFRFLLPSFFAASTKSSASTSWRARLPTLVTTRS